MERILTVSALLLFISGNVLAGSEYDRCVKEEKALKAQEAGECSGLRYLLDPSSCFATQKALKVYTVGKCRKIGIAENVDFNAQPVIPEKKNSSTGSAAGVSSKAGSADTVPAKKAEPEALQQVPAIERLKEENTRLKAEVSRLKAENDQLRNAAR